MPSTPPTASSRSTSLARSDHHRALSRSHVPGRCCSRLKPCRVATFDRLTQVYGPTTWDVYERLDRSLDPNGPDWLHELADQYLHPDDVVLDAGCRDGEHLIRLVSANQVTGWRI